MFRRSFGSRRRQGFPLHMLWQRLWHLHAYGKYISEYCFDLELIVRSILAGLIKLRSVSLTLACAAARSICRIL